MNKLSDISQLFSKHVSEIERAREVYTMESRNFVEAVLQNLRQTRAEPWLSQRIRINLDSQVEKEGKVTGSLRSQYAVFRARVRFKKGTNFMLIGELNLGIGWREPAQEYHWIVSLVPAAKYSQLDDVLWRKWREANSAALPVGSGHSAKANTICFVARPVDGDLFLDVAYNDAKQVLDFILSSETALAEAIGLDLSPEEEETAAFVPDETIL